MGIEKTPSSNGAAATRAATSGTNANARGNGADGARATAAPAPPGGDAGAGATELERAAKAKREGTPATGSGAADGAAAGTTQAPPPKAGPKPQKSTTDRLEEARAHVPPPETVRNLPPEDQESIRASYRAEQSRLYDGIATDLENQGPPERDDYKVGGKVLDSEYQQATAYYYDQLEEAQQGAKPAREARMREELAQTPSGREMLEFERRAGVPIKVLTDREWRAAGHDPNTLAFSSGDDGLTFNVRHLNTHVYVHEMTHQVDHRTRVLAPEGDTRTRQQVIDEAAAKYREFGLDPTEVPALVDATYHQPDLGASLTHAHTRLAEARHHRLEEGGQPLSEVEMREVLALALPREQAGYYIDEYNDHKDDGYLSAGVAELKLRDYAQSRGIDTSGLSADQVAERLQASSEEANAHIEEIERRGTVGKDGLGAGIGGIGGAIAGLGEIAGAISNTTDASLPAGSIPMGIPAEPR